VRAPRRAAAPTLLVLRAPLLLLCARRAVC
jgi:hypothetical protein